MTAGALNVVLAGGGTGGHVIPAIALAEEVARRGGTARFVGTRDRLEATLVPKAGFAIDFIEVRPLAGGGAKQILSGLGSVPRAVLQSMELLRKIEAEVVLGVGGYVAGPVVLAAEWLQRRTALLEQNARVGLTNKLLTRVVKKAFVSYEETLGAFPKGVAELTGNPVKRSIAEAAVEKRREEYVGPVRLLVIGGSQGARAIDDRVPAAIATAALEGEVSVTHQSVPDNVGAVERAYRKSGIAATVLPFIDDMAGAYRFADLVIARSGATTVSELAVMGLPAIFLPYPHHKDRQQERNAEPMRRAGAAVVLDERRSGIAEMAEAIARFVRDPVHRAAAARASGQLGRPGAASAIVDGLEALVRGRS